MNLIEENVEHIGQEDHKDTKETSSSSQVRPPWDDEDYRLLGKVLRRRRLTARRVPGWSIHHNRGQSKSDRLESKERGNQLLRRQEGSVRGFQRQVSDWLDLN